MKAINSVGCSYCGAKPGEQCIVTLSEQPEPLSIRWHHNSRNESAS